jgi:hypothetical protein
LTERDVTTVWRNLFKGQAVTSESLTKAKSLLASLSPENPLRLRLATELEDLRKLQQKT